MLFVQQKEAWIVSQAFSSRCLRCHSSSSPSGKHRATSAGSIFPLAYDPNGNLTTRTVLGSTYLPLTLKIIVMNVKLLLSIFLG